MVVEEDGVYPVANDTVQLATADVYRKDGMYDRKHQEVQLRLKETSNSEGDPAAPLAFLFLLIGFAGWKIWLGSRSVWPESWCALGTYLQKSHPLFWSQKLAPRLLIAPVQLLRLGTERHVEFALRRESEGGFLEVKITENSGKETWKENITREEYAETHTQCRRKPRLSRDLARWHGEAVRAASPNFQVWEAAHLSAATLSLRFSHSTIRVLQWLVGTCQGTAFSGTAAPLALSSLGLGHLGSPCRGRGLNMAPGSRHLGNASRNVPH